MKYTEQEHKKEEYGTAKSINWTKPQKEVQALSIKSARQLQSEELQPVQFIVEDILPHGLSIVASPPKTGKSWFVLDLCIAVAEGKNFLGKKTSKCEVLYLALEDSYNRLNDRTGRITDGSDYPDGLYYTLECSTLSNGLEEQIGMFMADHPNTKLIVFDTLQYIRSSSKGKNDNAYQSDYNEMKIIKGMASKYDLCILLVHHSRKESNPGDPFANISGTYGINGAMDAMITVTKENRSDKQAKMSICGRDVEYCDYMIEFDNEHGKWKLTGTAEEYQLQQEVDTYNQNPIVYTIKKLVDTNSGKWSGKISDIISSSGYYGNQIHDTAKKIGGSIQHINTMLSDHDSITCTIRTNGNAPKIYEYIRETPWDV